MSLVLRIAKGPQFSQVRPVGHGIICTKLKVGQLNNVKVATVEKEQYPDTKPGQISSEQAIGNVRFTAEQLTKKQTISQKYCLFSIQFVPSVRSIVHAYQYGPVLYTFF